LGYPLGLGYGPLSRGYQTATLPTQPTQAPPSLKPGDSNARGSGQRLLNLGLICAPALLLVALAWAHRWTSDDGFIALHVVDNLRTGHGPVFNVSERVEVYTSPLWVGLLALITVAAAPFSSGRPPIEWEAVFLGLASSGFALVFAGLGGRNLWRSLGSRATLLPFGTLVVIALVPFWDFTTSGLESSLVFLWLGASFFGLSTLLSRAPPSNRAFLLAALFGLGPLVRPDLGLFSLIFVAVLIVFMPGNLRRLACIACAGALPLAYQVFRMGYFASLVPNPALAKEAWLANWPRGRNYLRDFFTTYQLGIPIGVFIPVGAHVLAGVWRREAPREALVFSAPIVGGLLYGLYVVRWGGDFLHARMLLPALFAILIPLSAVPASIFKWLAVLLVPWALASAFLFRFPKGNEVNGIERGRMNYVESAHVPHPVTIQDFKDLFWASDVTELLKWNPEPGKRQLYESLEAELQPWLQTDIVVRRGAIGMASFAGGQRVYICDAYGLADPVGSRLRLRKWGKESGHDKGADTSWCVGRVLAEIENLKKRLAGIGSTLAFNQVRAALQCGDLAKLQVSITAPLTWSRFWSNVWIAPRLTRLRIPPEPAAAYAEFCGSGLVPLPGDGSD
jgi:arabinofuranosyltransferase